MTDRVGWICNEIRQDKDITDSTSVVYTEKRN